MKCFLKIYAIRNIIIARPVSTTSSILLSLLGAEIGSFDVGAQVYLLDRLQDQVDEGDPPPNEHPDYEEILLVEPTEEVHVSDLNFENFGALCATQVPSKQDIHQLDQCSHP